MNALEHLGAGSSKEPEINGGMPFEDRISGDPKMLEDGSQLIDTRIVDGVEYNLVVLPDGRRVTRVPMPEMPSSPAEMSTTAPGCLTSEGHNWSVTVGQRVNGRLSLAADAAPGHEQFVLSALQNITGDEQVPKVSTSSGAIDATETPSHGDFLTGAETEQFANNTRREQINRIGRSIGNIPLRRAVIMGGAAAYLFVAAPFLYKLTARDNGDLISWGLPLPSIESPVGDVEWIWNNTLGHIF